MRVNDDKLDENTELQVSITWDRQAYHIGEEPACTITIANVYKRSTPSKQSSLTTPTRTAHVSSDKNDHFNSHTKRPSKERLQRIISSGFNDDNSGGLPRANRRFSGLVTPISLETTTTRGSPPNDELSTFDVQGPAISGNSGISKRRASLAAVDRRSDRLVRQQGTVVPSLPLHRESLDINRNAENHFQKVPRTRRHPSGDSRAGPAFEMSDLSPDGDIIQPESTHGVHAITDLDLETASNHSSTASPSVFDYGETVKREYHSASNFENSDRSMVQRLMMGTVQFLGFFEPDPSLIDSVPFEDIRHQVVSQVNGGIVGVKSSRRDSSFLKTLGFGSISSTLGNVLSTKPSTINSREQRTKSRHIPVITTPQSVLFVGLDLRAGEQREYRFKYQLPLILPPSYKGRAIRIWYSLAVGIQLAGSDGKAQDFKQFDAQINILQNPQLRFRNPTESRYDFLRPHLIFTDIASVSNYSYDLDQTSKRSPQSGMPNVAHKISSYASEILGAQPRHGRDGDSASLNHSEDQLLARERRADNLAIVDIESTIDIANATPNIYHIRKAQISIATITMLRTSYFLGEDIHIYLSLTEESTTSHGLIATLETVEQISHVFALRSPSSIDRATKKIYDTWTRPLFSNRNLNCVLRIPSLAAATFETSLLNLEWRLRLEFFVSPGEESISMASESHYQGQHSTIIDERGLVDRLVANQDVLRAEILLPISVRAS